MMDPTSSANTQYRLANAPSTGNVPSQAQTPPTALSDIPGLGPIRVRALKKAGFESLNSLKEAPLERLLEVPGLTEIKAAFIKEYLGQFAAPEADTRAQTVSPKSMQTEKSKISATRGDNATQVIGAGALVLGEIINLLLIPQASEYRSRLLREIGRLSQRTQSLLLDAEFLSSENQERAIKRLKRATEEISAFAKLNPEDRKVQTKLADTLEELGAKLAECGLSNEATESAKA